MQPETLDGTDIFANTRRYLYGDIEFYAEEVLKSDQDGFPEFGEGRSRLFIMPTFSLVREDIEVRDEYGVTLGALLKAAESELEGDSESDNPTRIEWPSFDHQNQELRRLYKSQLIDALGDRTMRASIYFRVMPSRVTLDQKRRLVGYLTNDTAENVSSAIDDRMAAYSFEPLAISDAAGELRLFGTKIAEFTSYGYQGGESEYALHVSNLSVHDAVALKLGRFGISFDFSADISRVGEAVFELTTEDFRREYGEYFLLDITSQSSSSGGFFRRRTRSSMTRWLNETLVSRISARSRQSGRIYMRDISIGEDQINSLYEHLFPRSPAAAMSDVIDAHQALANDEGISEEQRALHRNYATLLRAQLSGQGEQEAEQAFGGALGGLVAASGGNPKIALAAAGLKFLRAGFGTKSTGTSRTEIRRLNEEVYEGSSESLFTMSSATTVQRRFVIRRDDWRALGRLAFKRPPLESDPARSSPWDPDNPWPVDASGGMSSLTGFPGGGVMALEGKAEKDSR